MLSYFQKKDEKPFLDRKLEYNKIIAKYPDKVPIIIKPYHGNAPVLRKNKFLVHRDLTVGEFMYIIRKQFKTKENEAVFLFRDNVLLNISSLCSEIHEPIKRDPKQDGFVYLSLSCENTFGNF